LVKKPIITTPHGVGSIEWQSSFTSLANAHGKTING